ncbi:MAG TPA: 4-alpha-glucanotransferase [Candidatus Acidoferrales bacterium]|jgi:hypothetical protein|nr:4-alpha-glucanotransferase [Candidatus Acidoferrales bacterium]
MKRTSWLSPRQFAITAGDKELMVLYIYGQRVICHSLFRPIPATSGQTRSYSCLTSIASHDSLPVFPGLFQRAGTVVGNPVYNWDTVRATRYRWSIDRERAQLVRVDAIRLNHFRGFAATWYAPAGAPTAQSAPFAFFTPHYDIAREYFPFF